MHLWFNGRTLASQAEYAGPIPVRCSDKNLRLAVN